MKPLKGQRIEAKPKRVIHHSGFKDELGALRNARLLLQFNDLIDHIANGWRVPEEYYRLDVDRNRDALLSQTGVKHLHLGGRGSNTLVYLVEQADRVILLRIAGHAYLEDEPRGSLLARILGIKW